MEESYTSADGNTEYVLRASVSDEEDTQFTLAQHSDAGPSQPARRRVGGRQRSPLWGYFTMMETGKMKDDAKCNACQEVLKCAQPGDDLLPHLLACRKVKADVRKHAERIQQEMNLKKRKRSVVYCTADKCVCTCGHVERVDDTNHETAYPPVSAQEFQFLVARVFYTCLMAFAIVERTAFVDLFQKIRPDLKLPSRHQLGGALLQCAYDDCKTRVVECIKKEGHVSVVSDGWSDQNSSSIVNIVVAAPGMRSMLWSSVATGANAHDADYMSSLLKESISDIQLLAVVAGVTTDNAPNMKAALRSLERDIALFGAGCSAHVLNLLLQDIGNAVALFGSVKDRALDIIRFVRYHHALLETFRSLQKELLTIFQRRRALQFPVATRWYSMMACFKSVLSNKDVLEKLFRGSEFESLRLRYQSTAASRAKLERVQKTIRDRDNDFWTPLKKAVHFMEPIVDALRQLEGDSCPTSHVYAHFRSLLFHEEFKSARPKEFLAEDAPEYASAVKLAEWEQVNAWDSDEEKILKLVWKRWRFVHSPVFGIAFLLDPHSDLDLFVQDDLENAVEQACAFAKRAKITERHGLDEKEYKRRLNKFVVDRKKWSRERRERHEDPKVWWDLYGSKFAFVKELAQVVFAVPPSSAASERNWSTYNLVHTKTRNRLGTKKVEMLAFVYGNDGIRDDARADDDPSVGPEDFPDHEAAQFLPRTDE